MSAPEKHAPVKLQVNNSGAWKDVLRFDAANDVASAEAMEAAATLGRIDAWITWRICTDDGLQTVLTHWSAERGWKAWNA